MLAWATGLATMGCAAAAAVLGAIGDDGLSWKRLLLSAVWVLPGVLIAAGRPRVAIGWLLLGVSLIFAVSGLADHWVARHDSGGFAVGWAIWWSDRFSALVLPLMMLALLLLPDGRLPSPRWGMPVAALVAVQLALVAAWSFVSGPAAAPDSEWPQRVRDVANPVGVLPNAVGDAIAEADLLVLQGPFLLAVLAFGLRVRRAAPDERGRIVSVLLAGAVFAVLVVVGRLLWPAASDVLDVLAGLLLAVVLTAAVLRRRLHEVDVVVHHAVVFGTLTLLIAITYVAVSAAAAQVGQDLPPFGAGVVAAVVALAAHPLRARLQRVVDRLMRGDRQDPYRALQRLADRTHDAPTVPGVLDELAATVAASLRAPWVQVNVDGRSAEHGERRTGSTEINVPLLVGDAHLGEVRAAIGAGRRLATDETELLNALGRHGGLSVQAALLSEHVQASRARIVLARGEEQRRLRRELHDGLGPVLAGLTMQLGAVQQMLASDPITAERELERLTEVSRRALDDLREVSRGLRPPALDQLGLTGCLRELASTLEVRVHVESTELPDLPAATEVAAYRIAAEALANAGRHAGPGEVMLRVCVDGDELVVEVRDQGSGRIPSPNNGVGLLSMRERAEELGGCVDVDAVPGVGTTVTTRLPLRDRLREVTP